jgi:preprotein translocase subunit Sec61beta
MSPEQIVIALRQIDPFTIIVNGVAVGTVIGALSTLLAAQS